MSLSLGQTDPAKEILKGLKLVESQSFDSS